ncbi:MAG TPA: L,D-transpeptidase family protein [Puia sp.]|nr:L,D-transpeptidase family protein [Puia sp.]
MNHLRGTVLFIIFISATLLWNACNNSSPKTIDAKLHDTASSEQSEKDLSLPGSFSSQTELHFDSTQINLFISRYPLFKLLQTDIQKFYQSRNYAYAWYDTKGIIEQADNLYNKMMNISEEGLPETILYKDSLMRIFDDTVSTQIPENELMLTSQYFDYANKVWRGISEKQSKSLNWFIPRKKLDVLSLMDSMLKDTSSSFIKNGYSHRQYNLLKEYLQQYRTLDQQNNWAEIKTNSKSFRKGDKSETIIAIRQRLNLLGDLPVNSSSTFFDQGLEDAVKNFQSRFGMKIDGVIGKEMIKQLNIQPENYIRQIIVNMERCRWVPNSLDKDYLVVNIPAFTLTAYEKDSVVFSMNVVVGQTVHKTVIFNGDLKYIVFSPYWNVPPDILKKEILPGIKKDPNYLSKHNMEWNGKTVRQKPGPDNSLGLVKFLFPNEYHIYLHDNPAKSLFNEHVRAFSHGCIRVANPKKLASYLLRKNPEWTEEKIDRAMKSGKEQYVTLKDEVPVYIAYLTAWVDRTGRLNLRKDIYNRDNRLEAMILKN